MTITLTGMTVTLTGMTLTVIEASPLEPKPDDESIEDERTELKFGARFGVTVANVTGRDVGHMGYVL